jgi:hypothetical protein
MTDNTDIAVSEGADVPEKYPSPADVNAAFEPMADAFAQPEAEQPIYNDDFEGIAGAAKELVERRSSLERPEVERAYRDGGGYGERTPANQFVSAEKGAADLQAARDLESEYLEQARNAEVQRLADELRGQAQPQPEQPAVETPQPPLEAQPEQAEQPGETRLQKMLREDGEFRGQVEAMVQAAEAYQARAAAELQAERTRLQQEFTARAN